MVAGKPKNHAYMLLCCRLLRKEEVGKKRITVFYFFRGKKKRKHYKGMKNSDHDMQTNRVWTRLRRDKAEMDEKGETARK